MSKKLLLLLVILALNFAPAKAQWVTIPDANFVTRLTQLFPSCMNGNQMDTTCADIVNATSINVTNFNITNLSGVEYFDNLIDLDCSYNYLTALPNLPSNLQRLYCAVNQLISLPPLPISLTELNCSYNQLIYIPQVPSSMDLFYIDNNNINCLSNLPFVADTSFASIFNPTCSFFTKKLVKPIKN